MMAAAAARWPEGTREEWRGEAQSMALARLADLPDVPVTVLTALRNDIEPGPGIDMDLVRRSYEVKAQVHIEMSELVTMGRHVAVPESGHFIHRELPELVVAEIIRVLDMVGR